MKRTFLLAAGALILWTGLRGNGGPAVGCAEPALHLSPFDNAVAEVRGLTIVSVNLGKETDDARIAAELRRSGLLERADVLSLQEVQREAQVAERLAYRLEMSAAVAGTGPGGEGENTDGVALLSRYPLRDAAVIPLPRNGLGIRTRCRVAIAATVRGVRVVGLHLDTRVNAQRRIEQVEPILAAAAAFEGPVALAGDFNTNSFWWVKHLIPIPFVADQARPLVEHLADHGFDSPFRLGGAATNDFLGLQLDWVFLRGLGARDSGIEPLGFTDHHAVWVQASFR